MKKIPLSLTLITICLSICMFSCKSKKDDTEKEKTKVKYVKTIELSEKEISRDIDYPANLMANEEVYLVSGTPGKIMGIYTDVGKKVYRGQVLVSMDATQYNNTKLQLQNLEKDMARMDTLIKYGGISQQQYDQMKTQVEMTKSNLSLLGTNTVLTAPFSGIVTAKYFESGELYSGAPNTPVGKVAILVIQQIKPIKAQISISEKYFPIVKKGMKVNLTTDIYPDTVFNGEISLIHPTINASSKTFNIEIQIANSNEKLRPGMYAKVNLEFAKEKAKIVPATTVLQQMGTNNRYVFVYKDGKAKRVNVTVGKRFDDQIEIISDEISIGDKLLTSGHANLVDGAQVKIVE